MWHKPCRTFHPWCPCIKTRCLFTLCEGNTAGGFCSQSPGPADPDSKVHGTNMGPTWGRQDPGGPHVGPMNFAIWGAKQTNGLVTGDLRRQNVIIAHNWVIERPPPAYLYPHPVYVYVYLCIIFIYLWLHCPWCCPVIAKHDIGHIAMGRLFIYQRQTRVNQC